MKYRWIIVFSLLLAAGAALSAQTSPAEPASPAKQDAVMLVRLEKTAVRMNPSFVSPVIGFAAYKTPFAVLRIEGDWVFGYAQGFARAGYVPASALSQVKISLSADSSAPPSELQQSEIVLAGKGFASSLEESLKNGDSFNFDAVDAMETVSYSFGECMAFIQGADSTPEAL